MDAANNRNGKIANARKQILDHGAPSDGLRRN